MKAQRYVWLTVTGYVFYAFWNYKFCALMFFSTMVSYMAGLGLPAVRRPNSVGRRIWLIVPITVDLTLSADLQVHELRHREHQSCRGLVWHADRTPTGRYCAARRNLLLHIPHDHRNIVDILSRGDPHRHATSLSSPVMCRCSPAGGRVQLCGSDRLRATSIGSIARTGVRDWINFGWSFFVIGMIKKDHRSRTVSPWSWIRALAGTRKLRLLSDWLCVLGYTYQLYFDFSGYSDMAVGLGHMFRTQRCRRTSGLRTRRPASVTSGGAGISRCPRACATISTSPSAEARGSAWHVEPEPDDHDASGRALARGTLDVRTVGAPTTGLLLVFYRSVERPWSRLPIFVQRGATFLLVLVGWCFSDPTACPW